jgi:hypothetical protein
MPVMLQRRWESFVHASLIIFFPLPNSPLELLAQRGEGNL